MCDEAGEERTYDPFPKTSWTNLGHAAEGDAGAWGRLLEDYHAPIARWFGRRAGPGEDPDELLHDFLDYVRTKGIPAKADRDRGRFRAYIQAVAGLWLKDHRKRAARRGVLEFDEGAMGIEAEQAAEREWAHEWLRDVIERAANHALAPEISERFYRYYGIGRPREKGPEIVPEITEADIEAWKKAERTRRLNTFNQEMRRAREKFGKAVVELLRAEMESETMSEDQVEQLAGRIEKAIEPLPKTP